MAGRLGLGGEKGRKKGIARCGEAGTARGRNAIFGAQSVLSWCALRLCREVLSTGGGTMAGGLPGANKGDGTARSKGKTTF
jgi:hypothetical protein